MMNNGMGKVDSKHVNEISRRLEQKEHEFLQKSKECREKDKTIKLLNNRLKYYEDDLIKINKNKQTVLSSLEKSKLLIQ